VTFVGRGLSTREQLEQESVLSARGRSIGLAGRLGEGGVDEIGSAKAKGGAVIKAFRWLN
jgi:hypothetical protein